MYSYRSIENIYLERTTSQHFDIRPSFISIPKNTTVDFDNFLIIIFLPFKRLGLIILETFPFK